MYKEKLITFPTAKLAKEKKITLFTKNVWLNCSRFSEPHEGTNSIRTFGGYADDVIEYPRPSQAILQTILREVHNIDVQSYLIELIYNENQKEQKTEDKEYGYRIYNKGISIYCDFKEGLTYEEALEEGLIKGLEEINKENKS